jgi:Protein of unknown function (DUF4235)
LTKILFAPFSIAAGFLAGLVSRKAFALVWSASDDQAPPTPKTQGASIGKLALALTLEGALFRLVKGLADHGSRRSFASLTGIWPGEKQTEQQSQSE